MKCQIVLVCVLTIIISYVKSCGEVFTDKEFLIESLNYPGDYPVNYQCSYLIKGPTCPTKFTFKFLDFSIEKSLGCVKDRLEIEDKDAICGNKTHQIKEYSSQNGNLVLKFISDSDVTSHGYRIQVTRSECQNHKMTQHCCQSSSYNSKSFTLVSPNFPYSATNTMECSYVISKASPDICRLRILIDFFWLGYTQNCKDAYLEIDGKYICGCQSNLKVIVPFGDANHKKINFLSSGLEKRSYSGFVIKVIQDECPRKIKPTEKFHFYNDQINRVSWPNQSVILDKFRLIRENTEILPQITKSVYFYDYQPKEVEETEYLDTSSDTSTVPNVIYDICREWNQVQFNGMRLASLPQCQTKQDNGFPNNCITLNRDFGFIKSPGYPFYYPGNLKLCYRFEKSPNSCGVHLKFKDFDLQRSSFCESDSLLVKNQKFCGNSLIHTFFRFEPYDTFFFTSDPFYCGRGFLAHYQQIPCAKVPTTPPPSPPVCSQIIQDEVFTLSVWDYLETDCLFTIRKFKEDVCLLQLYFEIFDLTCSSESLIIDGTMYCGKMTGQYLNLDNPKSEVTIVYRKGQRGIDGQRVLIKGRQITECAVPEVPAERLKNPQKTVFLKMKTNFTEICGIVKNRFDSPLPDTFCDILMTDGSVKSCLPLKDNSIFVPLGSEKLELKLKNVKASETIVFEKVSCNSDNNK